MSNSERDYILGTHDDEVERLGLQHRVWRPRAADAWMRAGISVGQTVLDVGCGPGYASTDLAEIVGPKGKVVSIDRSRRFLDTLESRRQQLGIANIEVHELDLDQGSFPQSNFNAAWARWVFAFVKQPRDLLTKIHTALKPGGVFVVHEYLDYSAWRAAPRNLDMEEFVRIVMESWRSDGGEPDIGLALPGWLNELGFEIKSMKPIVDIVDAKSFLWQWPIAFMQTGLQRLVDIGKITVERAKAISTAFQSIDSTPGTLMITPIVIEIIAVRE